tara:strand:- start:1072 stop:1983 length:912 start_codon:yes stop_codon:yes gene_type:complete
MFRGSFVSKQSGVALLQVLLLGATMSLLAIRFTETARDQIEIAGQFEGRVIAQLAAHSAISEVVFLQLSTSVESRLTDQADDLKVLSDDVELNFYGAPIRWGEAVTLRIQDLNGLLPQIFPQHPLWGRFLTRKLVPEDDIARYLGVWRDMQDNDIQSWLLGDVEPQSLPTGQTYPNGLAQSNKVARWVFADQPQLAEDILEASDVFGTYDTNPFNYSKPLLYSLFDAGVADEIILMRSQSSPGSRQLNSLLPAGFRGDYIFDHYSGRLKLDVAIDLGFASWSERRVIHLQAGSQPPFRILLRN